jgi:hypothetical protein
MRVSLRDDDVPVFAKPDGASPLMTRIKAGEEMDLGKSVKTPHGQWVETTLADGRRGYISGATRIHKIKPATLKQDEADMYERPAFDAARKARLTKGQRFLLLDVVQAGTASWVRIRDEKGQEGFIHGDTSVHTEGEEPSVAAKTPAKGELPRSAKPAAPRKAGALDIRNGLVAIVLGGILTGGSYVLAPQLGGKYYVTWGIVALGVFWLLRGIFRKIGGK